MRLGAIPGNLLERVLLRLDFGPTPLLDTMIAMLLCRTLMAATQAGVFDALEAGPLTPGDVAARCQLNEEATGRLLFALAGAGYLKGRNGRYSLRPVARKWMLRRSRLSLHDAVLHRYLDLELMGHCEEYLRTGSPTRFHERMSPEQWSIYQRGQRSHAVFSAAEVARKTPAPRRPREMLDIGGSHGLYSAALCRRHPTLRSTILDLPEAVTAAAPILEAEGLGDRVRHRCGNALTDDLGIEEYDLVFLGNLVHHFTAEVNRQLMERVATALRPGGSVVILEIIRLERPDEAGQIGALTGLFFAVTSEAGTWSFPEMASWQREAGLTARSPIQLVTAPGYGLQAAFKPPGAK